MRHVRSSALRAPGLAESAIATRARRRRRPAVLPALSLIVAAVATLAACGKASETAAEKAIESSMAREGTQAKVKLSEGAISVTTTDAAGKVQQTQIGQVPVSEAELGLPFYPGSKPSEGSSLRMVSGAGSSFQVGMHSDDAPDKVAAFYREKLRAMAEGKNLMDMSSNDGASLTLVDDKARSSLQVHVSKAEKGSDIAIQSTRSGEK